MEARCHLNALGDILSRFNRNSESASPLPKRPGLGDPHPCPAFTESTRPPVAWTMGSVPYLSSHSKKDTHSLSLSLSLSLCLEKKETTSSVVQVQEASGSTSEGGRRARSGMASAAGRIPPSSGASKWPTNAKRPRKPSASEISEVQTPPWGRNLVLRESTQKSQKKRAKACFPRPRPTYPQMRPRWLVSAHLSVSSQNLDFHRRASACAAAEAEAEYCRSPFPAQIASERFQRTIAKSLRPLRHVAHPSLSAAHGR